MHFFRLLPLHFTWNLVLDPVYWGLRSGVMR